MLNSVKSLASGLGDLAVKKVASSKSLGKFAGGMAGALSLGIEFAKSFWQSWLLKSECFC